VSWALAERVVVGSDTDRLFKRRHKDFAVTDLTGAAVMMMD
jgi:hypothetical protein